MGSAEFENGLFPQRMRESGMDTDKFSGWYVGRTEEMTFEVTDEKVRMFAEITGDKNPVHLDEDFAKLSLFGQRIAHGMLSAGFLSAFLAQKMPGPGAIYRKQSLKFMKPVYIPETIKIVGTIKDLEPSRGVFTIQTQIFKENGELCVDGEAVAILR